MQKNKKKIKKEKSVVPTYLVRKKKIVYYVWKIEFMFLSIKLVKIYANVDIYFFLLLYKYIGI